MKLGIGIILRSGMVFVFLETIPSYLVTFYELQDTNPAFVLTLIN